MAHRAGQEVTEGNGVKNIGRRWYTGKDWTWEGPAEGHREVSQVSGIRLWGRSGA